VSGRRSFGVISIEAALITLASVVVIFGQRFVIPLSSFAIPIIVFTVYLVLGAWLLLGKIRINWLRLALYLITVVFLSISYILSSLRGNLQSLPSFIYLLVLYLPVIAVHRGGAGQDRYFAAFQGGMLAAAVLGIIQFVLQYLGISLSALVFDHLPNRIIDQQYNYLIRISATSPYYKANGVFMLEPSFFSKWLAVAVLVVLLRRTNPRRLLAYLPAMLLSFSGTGMITLGIGAVLQAVRLRLRWITIFFLLTMPILALFMATEFWEFWWERLGEFGRTGTSADLRFIAPYQAMAKYIQSGDSVTFLFGAGAGTVDDEFIRLYSDRNLHPPLVLKLLYEYGFFATISFLALLLVCFFHQTELLPLAISLFIMYAFLSTGLLQPQTFYLCYFHLMLFRRENLSSTALFQTHTQ
jgi:hypothetical protein